MNVPMSSVGLPLPCVIVNANRRQKQGGLGTRLVTHHFPFPLPLPPPSPSSSGLPLCLCVDWRDSWPSAADHPGHSSRPWVSQSRLQHSGNAVCCKHCQPRHGRTVGKGCSTTACFSVCWRRGWGGGEGGGIGRDEGSLVLLQRSGKEEGREGQKFTLKALVQDILSPWSGGKMRAFLSKALYVAQY